MDSQARKRTCPCDGVEMPGSFPRKQKLRTRRAMAAKAPSEKIDQGSLLSLMLFPVRMAKEWLFGSPTAASWTKKPQTSIKHEQKKQNDKTVAHQSRQSRNRSKKRESRHRVPATKPLATHHQSFSRSRRPLVTDNKARTGGLLRDRTNELVRHYTMPSNGLGASSNAYSRWRSTSQSSSQTESEVLSEFLSLNTTDDPSQSISFDSQSAISIDDSLPEIDRASPRMDDAQAGRKAVGMSKSELWIAQLRKKIEQSLQVTVPAKSVATPAYDLICKDEGELERRIERERQKKSTTRILLPADADSVISSAFKAGFSREINNTPVTAQDIVTLKPGTWLNDEVINYYMQLIISRAEKTSGLPRVHAFNTFFFSTLRDSGYMRVRRWTRKTKLFEKDLAIVPVHLGVHWCCAAIDFRKKTIAYYDALLGDNEECLQLLMQYLHEESKDKVGCELDASEWSMVCAKDIPRQKNGYDCGVFAITFAEYLARDAPLVFSQSHCPTLRRKIIYEIASGALL